MTQESQQKPMNFFKKQLPWMVLAVIMFLLGHEYARFNHHQEQKQVSMLSQSSSNLAVENQQLIEQVNKQKIQADLTSLRLESTNALLSESLERESELKEQLRFYQRVMAPETSSEGFLVEHAEVVKLEDNNSYRLSLILLQRQNVKDTITGNLNIKVHGIQDGKFTILSMREISADSQQFAYSFKYFQVKDIPFVMPSNFSPERIEISTDVYKYKRKRGSYNTAIAWAELLIDNT